MAEQNQLSRAEEVFYWVESLKEATSEEDRAKGLDWLCRSPDNVLCALDELSLDAALMQLQARRESRGVQSDEAHWITVARDHTR